MADTILRMENISKRFPGVNALVDCHFDLNRGEVHGLVGENGAGKSTLMKILCGIYKRDGGTIEFDGTECDFDSTRESLKSGISMIHQELNLMPHLSIAQNMYIGRENDGKKGFLVNDRLINAKTQEYLDELHIRLKPTDKVGTLTVAKQQMVEIAKAISFHSKILVMDEPTAALTDEEIEELFRIVVKLKKSGIGIIYISHRMDELKKICDRITVMRDGRYISTDDASGISIDEIISKMVGRKLEGQAGKRTSSAEKEVVLRIEHLCGHSRFSDVSFDLHKGEILGFSGLMGAGRTETMRTIFGADKKTSGEIWVKGKKAVIKNTKDAVRCGIGYLSEDRKAFGIMHNLSLVDNMMISSYKKAASGKGMVVDAKKCQTITEAYIQSMNIKTPGAFQKIKFLSGGNQQKVIISKWLINDCDILIFDEPTRGIDVGAKTEIYNLLEQLAKEGKSIIMISSEMPEILRLSDRIAVMCEGHLKAVLDGKTATSDEIMKYATAR